MSCADDYSPQLRARGYRMTPQRLAILHVLHHEGRHLSPVEVHEEARRELPNLTETTVYRTLEFLAENGLARPALAGSGHLTYEIARHEHHHLVCRLCGKEIEVGHDILKSMYARLESESGYRLTDSHLTFFGLCPDCQKGE
ncbi:MAG: transcriptional repressor [Anaerolineales bacterium]|jgi:Fe2+ or Zn2+ uptake regulation protein|nr:transcriptional repressor [Anaerolineales bacterium]